MTTPTLPIYDAAALANALKERNLPGRRSKTAITRLRRERARRNVHGRPLTLQDRLNRRLLDIYVAEVEHRGGETVIEGEHSDTRLSIKDRADGLTLLRAEGWRKYGRQGNRYVHLAYLCGKDDSGRWAVRVPGTVTDVYGALQWITPAAVRDAQYAGKRVKRQGDIYAIETVKAHDAESGWIGSDRRWDTKRNEWVTSHHWNAETRTLVHRPEDGRKHRLLRIPHPVRFAQQNVYGMGRGAGRVNGD